MIQLRTQQKRIRVLASMALLLLTACIPSLLSSTSATNTPSVQGTRLNATPTPDMAGFQIELKPQACLVKTLQSIRTSNFQGSLMSWSPDGKSLAWIQPTTAHLWFAGGLTVADGPDYANNNPIAQNASGSLFWSPEGDRIAYSALRPSENVFTVMVIDKIGGQPRDLFPGSSARLDNFSSPKAIIDWPTPDLLRVMVECGSSCIQYLDYDPSSGSPRPQDDSNPVDPTRVWEPLRVERSYTQEAFPVMIEPNWSADGNLVAYFDEKGHLWILQYQGKTAFQIQIPDYLPVNMRQPGDRETHWSKDGLLAVRIDDRLDIYKIPCQPE